MIRAGRLPAFSEEEGLPTMLTVKHITISGEEFVYATTHVNFVPGHAKGDQSAPPNNDSLWIYEGADERARELCGGTIFVMNERGSTVARYDIGASMVPLNGKIASAQSAYYAGIFGSKLSAAA